MVGLILVSTEMIDESANQVTAEHLKAKIETVRIEQRRRCVSALLGGDREEARIVVLFEREIGLLKERQRPRLPKNAERLVCRSKLPAW